MANGGAWTEERVELLTKHWVDGMSCSRIAAALGPDFTRNAVIGKIHRLGLAGRARAPSKPKPPRPARPSLLMVASVPPQHQRRPGMAPDLRIRELREIFAGLRVVPLPEVPLSLLDATKGDRCTVLMLTEKTCRWPIGDVANEDFHFCGLRPAAGRAYCEYHCRIAYQSVYQRRKAVAEEALVRRHLEAAE